MGALNKNPVRSAIIFSVCFVHLVFLSLLLFKSPFIPAKKQHKPILVKTVVVEPSRILIAEKKLMPVVSRTSSQSAVSTQAKKAVPAVKPVSKAQPKAPVEKKSATKKENPLVKEQSAKVEKVKSPVVQSPPPPSVSPSLLKELEESIAKIEDKSDKQSLSRKTNPKTTLSIPAPLQIDALPTIELESSDYISILTEHLHASLHLPDFGEVKIELTLQQDGTVAKLRVLKAESQQNRKYLESHLPLLKFPHLSGAFAKKNEHTFTLTFCNEL